MVLQNNIKQNYQNWIMIRLLKLMPISNYEGIYIYCKRQYNVTTSKMYSLFLTATSILTTLAIWLRALLTSCQSTKWPYSALFYGSFISTTGYLWLLMDLSPWGHSQPSSQSIIKIRSPHLLFFFLGRVGPKKKKNKWKRGSNCGDLILIRLPSSWRILSIA